MTVMRFRDLQDYWRIAPPLHNAVGALLGVGSKGKKAAPEQKGNIGDLVGDLAAAGIHIERKQRG